METLTKRYLTREEAAQYLTDLGVGIAATTLQKMASEGGGPAYRVIGRKALYKPAELEAWVDLKEQQGAKR